VSPDAWSKVECLDEVATTALGLRRTFVVRRQSNDRARSIYGHDAKESVRASSRYVAFDPGGAKLLYPHRNVAFPEVVVGVKARQ
jgi:hypothetical protein